MKTRNFIIKELNKIASQFPEISIRYEILQQFNTHLIEIKPLHIFEQDDYYLEIETDIESRFEKLFPDSEIVFISEESLNQISCVDYQIQGYDIVLQNIISSMINSEIDIPFNNAEQIKILDKSYKITDKLFDYSFLSKKLLLKKAKVIEEHFIVDSILDETNYAEIVLTKRIERKQKKYISKTLQQAA